MSTAYTIKTGDILLCDINTTRSGSSLTIPTYGGSGYNGGLCFNFHKEGNVQKQLDKTIYIIRKPGIPVGYEIGLGERVFNITCTIKAPTSTYASGLFYSLLDLNYLCNYQYNTVVTTGSFPSYGAIKLYYDGDDCTNLMTNSSTGFYTVMCKSLWYEQRPGRGTMFDVRVSLTEVVMPGT